jgi:2-oxoglutarate ferredoxin oxidoreductase subunit alpha
VGWGSTRGAITGALARVREAGHKASGCFLRHLNPFPRNLESLLRSFRKVLIPEMNLGQLALLLRARYLVDAESVSKVQGRPFTSQELESRILQALENLG